MTQPLKSTLEEKQEAFREELKKPARDAAVKKAVDKSEVRRQKKKDRKEARRKISATRDWEVAAMHLQVLGVPDSAIAKECGVHPSTILRFFRSERIDARRREIFGNTDIKKIKEELKSVWPLAIKAIMELLKSNDPNLIVQRANKGMEVLVALGAKEAEKIEITKKHIVDAAREAIIEASTLAKLDEEEKERELIGNA